MRAHAIGSLMAMNVLSASAALAEPPTAVGTSTPSSLPDPARTQSTTALDPYASSGQVAGARADSQTAVFDAGEITVRADRVATIDRAATQTVVTSKDIEAHSDRNLADTLQLIPGVSTYQHGKGHIRFRMRGFEMPYVALLVDGIPVADVYEANVDISKLLVMNASQIVINRGTSSALYGTNGTIGSINIITKKPLGLHAKVQGELGLNGDYLINAAHGNAIGGFYYWLTGTVDQQAPFDISARLSQETWFTRAMPYGLGYPVDPTTPAVKEYLAAKRWPHQDSIKYNVSGKIGYRFPGGIETGVGLSFTQSEARRYSISVSNTEEFTQGTWPTKDPTLTLGAGAFNWRNVYTASAAPYLQYQGGKFGFRGNWYYSYTYELLDGYQDVNESVPVGGWGGAHSNWRNTSSGVNLFPSYALAAWNHLNGSVLFRWDKHTERVQADSNFVGKGQAGGGADAAYALANYDWSLTKVMAGDQLTVAIEDELSLKKLLHVPIEITAGLSYDAQKMNRYRSRPQAMAQGRVTAFGMETESQYIVKSDSVLWGTRDSLNPVFGATYWPLEGRLLFRAAFSQKTKLPTLSQYANVLANSDVGLKAETSGNANAGVQVFFGRQVASVRADYFVSRFRDKLATVYDPATPTVRYYTNVEGQDHKGVEIIANGNAANAFGWANVRASLSYTYVQVRNRALNSLNSLFAKGNRVPDVPEHHITVDVQVNLATKTMVTLFGSFTANAIRYTMRGNPRSGMQFSGEDYRELHLHNPLMANLKASQAIGAHSEVYAMIRNLFDDYAADPFNPGPGRQFYLGATATY